MKVVIPMASLGVRFVEKGYTDPKPGHICTDHPMLFV